MRRGSRHTGGRHRRRNHRRGREPRGIAWAAPAKRSVAGAGCLALLAVAGVPSQTAADWPVQPPPDRTGLVRPGLAAEDGVAALARSGATASVRTVAASAVSRGGDIPATALAAYQRAAAVMERAAPECRLPWTLLAGIGRVESDHGRYGGAALGPDGVSSPRIIGVPLDGAGPGARISDTDAGELDGDRVWDRAVGPMQFIPSTWAVAGVDGDGDGSRSPHDIDDAALAAAVYLCAGSERLDEPAGMRAALLRYNHSQAYADLVMAFEREYRLGEVAVAAGPASVGTLPAVREGIARAMRRQPPQAAPAAEKAEPRKPAVPSATDRQDSSRQGTSGPTSTTDSAPKPAPKPSAEPAPTPTREPSPKPAPTPMPEPAPAGQDEPGTGPATEPALVTLEGLWTACGGGYSVGGTSLDLGDADLLTMPAAADYDGDGQVEEYTAELAGLVDRLVTVVVEEQETGWVVVSLNDVAYLAPVPAEDPPSPELTPESAPPRSTAPAGRRASASCPRH